MLSEKRNQLGRTLLEMLAVVSLIGMLSVASFELYGTAISSMQANDMLDQARNRVMMGDKGHRVKATYGMFEKRSSEASLTAYGYGIASRPEELISQRSGSPIEIDGHLVFIVPVGEIHGGRKIGSGLCKALVKRIHTNTRAAIRAGDLLDVCTDQYCKDSFDCEESDDITEIPPILYLAIKK